MTPWEQILERRKKNIGLIGKYYTFKPPTEAEKAVALAREIESWQASKGIRLPGWKVSESYSIPKGAGINLLRTREPGGKPDNTDCSMYSHWFKAVDAYVHTPMDHFGILKAQGIDVSRWERKPTIFHKLFWKFQNWIHREDYDWEPPNRTRLTKEFIKMFTIKENK
jgi:hypothetical protein